jgi:glycosyltransferase involved in cell wall biosynthesis
MTHTRMSILHVIARLNVGGAALHVIQLAAEQQRRGHDVLVVAGTLAPGEESMEYAAEEREVTVHRLPVLQRELSQDDAVVVRALRRIMEERHPDVLHTHTAKAGATGRIAAITLGRRRPAAVVHTFHGHVLRGYFGSRREEAFRRIERVLARRTDALIAVSAEVRDELVALGVAPRGRFVVIPYGFELTGPSAASERSRAAQRAALGIADDTFVIGWAGRLTDIKRPLDLVATLAETVRHGVDAVLVVVGDGTEREQTEQRARELGVLERCRFVGFQRRMDEWYPVFDALLLTSENEGTPVVAIEALAAERPVVATDAGGTGTVVRDGLSGYLVPIGDVEALGSRIALLAGDPALRSGFGRHGAADMRARFATERMTDDVETLYETLAGR